MRGSFATGGLQEEANKIITEFILREDDGHTSMTATLALRKVYLEAYGLMDTPPEQRTAMELVTLLPKENAAQGSALENLYGRFKKYEINKHTGYNFSQFIDLPRAVCEMIFRRTLYEESLMSNVTNNELNKLNDVLNNRGKRL